MKKFNWFASIRLGMLSFLIGIICRPAGLPFWGNLVLALALGLTYPEPMWLLVEEAKNDE